MTMRSDGGSSGGFIVGKKAPRATSYGELNQKIATRNIHKGNAKMVAGAGVAIVGGIVAGSSAARLDLLGVAAGGAAYNYGVAAASEGSALAVKGHDQRTRTLGMEGLIAKSQGNSAALGMRGIDRLMPQQAAPQNGRVTPVQAQQFQRANQNYRAPVREAPASDGKKKGWSDKARAKSAEARGAKWNGPAE